MFTKVFMDKLFRLIRGGSTDAALDEMMLWIDALCCDATSENPQLEFCRRRQNRGTCLEEVRKLERCKDVCEQASWNVFDNELLMAVLLSSVPVKKNSRSCVWRCQL